MASCHGGRLEPDVCRQIRPTLPEITFFVASVTKKRREACFFFLCTVRTKDQKKIDHVVLIALNFQECKKGLGILIFRPGYTKLGKNMTGSDRTLNQASDEMEEKTKN